MKYFGLLLLVFPSAAFAQRGAIDVKGSIGYVGFVDEGLGNHLHTGASARFYITNRFSVEPEFQYLYSDPGHYDIVFLPNVAWDFRKGRVEPYVTGGVGVLSSHFRGFGPPSSSSSLFGQVGGGAKIYLTERWFIAPEARFGWEANIRFTVGIGYSFRR